MRSSATKQHRLHGHSAIKKHCDVSNILTLSNCFGLTKFKVFND